MTMTTLDEIASELHAAYSYLFYPDPDLGAYHINTVIAEIHECWSSAMHSFRLKEPLVWHECRYNQEDKQVCDLKSCAHEAYSMTNDGTCLEDGECADSYARPEGVVVWLIKGCMFLLDLASGQSLPEIHLSDDVLDAISIMKLPSLVCLLHEVTTKFWKHYDSRQPECNESALDDAARIIKYVFVWLNAHQVNPEALLAEVIDYYAFNNGDFLYGDYNEDSSWNEGWAL